LTAAAYIVVTPDTRTRRELQVKKRSNSKDKRGDLAPVGVPGARRRIEAAGCGDAEGQLQRRHPLPVRSREPPAGGLPGKRVFDAGAGTYFKT